MIEIRTVTTAPEWGLAEGTPTRCAIGDALLAFMKEAKGRVRVSEVLEDALVLSQNLADTRVFIRYEGADAHLHPLLVALWYYTRHPHRRGLLERDDDQRLLACCRRFRNDISQEAAFYPGSGELDAHWRYTLLFTARVRDNAHIRRALRLPELTFEALIDLAVGKAGRSVPFSELLCIAETSTS